MDRYDGVAITDGKNRKNHIMPLSTLIKTYHDFWDKYIPVYIAHDRTKPIGLTRLSGIYLEPGKAYVTNESYFIETDEERQSLKKYISSYDFNIFCSEHNEQIEALKEKLKGVLSDEFAIAPVGQAVAIRDKEIVKKLFPEWTETFKDGLVNARELQAVYSVTKTGEKGCLIPGVYIRDGYLLFAHYFFRRTLSVLNTTNEEFFNIFEKVKNNTDVDIKLALDLDMIGLPGTETIQVEYQYIRGPLFNNDLSMIPEGVTCHENENYDNLLSNLLSTQFYWHVQDGKRTFECEELCDRENISFDERKEKLWGCRYVHSMLESDSGIPIHLDGAIRIYDEEQILERIDTRTDISKCGKNSQYKKLWRIDNEIPIYLWKELISAFYRENSLIGEYFGGIDKQYEAIVAADKNHNKEVKKPLDFSHIEFKPGDGIRVFFNYLEKFDLPEQIEVKVWEKAAILYNGGEKVKIIDSETITLLKLLKRRGVLLEIPITSRVDFNDMILNFPILCCKDSGVVDIVFNAIKDLCVAWNKTEDDRLISFGIRINLENESFQISFAGHIDDFTQLFKNIPRFSDCSINEWVDRIYTFNNIFKTANDYPDKFRLIYGNVVRFKRMIVPQKIIEKADMENEVLNVKLILPKEEVSYLSEHKIIVAPFFRIKKAICRKCGKDYLKCDCVKFIDENVTDELTELDMPGLIWTNRNTYFPIGKITFNIV